MVLQITAVSKGAVNQSCFEKGGPSNASGKPASAIVSTPESIMGIGGGS